MTGSPSRPAPPDPTDRCPCRSGATFEHCCAPILLGRTTPDTAEQLMRSRYTAYALHATEYLLASWHPSTRPATLRLDPTTQWRTLHIVDTVAGGTDDESGIVEFVARYRDADGSGLLAERSTFLRHDGRWTYVEAIPPLG